MRDPSRRSGLAEARFTRTRARFTPKSKFLKIGQIWDPSRSSAPAPTSQWGDCRTRPCVTEGATREGCFRTARAPFTRSCHRSCSALRGFENDPFGASHPRPCGVSCGEGGSEPCHVALRNLLGVRRTAVHGRAGDMRSDYTSHQRNPTLQFARCTVFYYWYGTNMVPVD